MWRGVLLLTRLFLRLVNMKRSIVHISSTQFFSLSATLPFSPPDQYSLPLATRSRHHEARNERKRQGSGDRGSLERRKEKTHNVYSSPIEDDAFQGSASVARI